MCFPSFAQEEFYTMKDALCLRRFVLKVSSLALESCLHLVHRKGLPGDRPQAATSKTHELSNLEQEAGVNAQSQ